MQVKQLCKKFCLMMRTAQQRCSEQGASSVEAADDAHEADRHRTTHSAADGV